MTDLINTLTVLTINVSPDMFVDAVQSQAIAFTKAQVDDVHSLRIMKPDFMQFNQGGVDEESQIALEVGFKQIKPLNLSYATLGFSEEEIAKPLLAIIGEALSIDFAKQVVDRIVAGLMLLGPMNAISKDADYVIFGFEKTQVLFMRHPVTVIH